MIYQINSEWEELNGKWIKAETKEEAREYLQDINCEYTFCLQEINGIPIGKIDYEVR